jgi:DNA (cytosine-5)-methyltransferase 1
MNLVDLFCGCGGFSLDAHEAGLATKLAIDIDPLLTSSFSLNFPQAKLALEDIGKLDSTAIRREVGGRVDGIVGGPPCQAFSEMGHRKADDPRRELLFDFSRLIRDLRPAFFIMENVRGLGYDDARHTLDRAIDLVANRYEILGPLILDPADFGAATRRPRLFVIGLNPSRCDSMSAHDIAAMNQTPSTVHDAIADLTPARYLREEDEFDVWRIARRGRPSNYARGLRSATREFTGHRFTQHTAAVIARFSALEAGDIDLVGKHPKLAWPGQCPTLRAGTPREQGSFQAVRPIHPVEARVITVREAARLQGFPDRFRFHPTIWHSTE